MTDELIKGFLEQMIEGLDGISEALRILHQYYHVVTAESEFEGNNLDNSSYMEPENEYADIDSYIEPGSEYMDNPPYINLEIDADID